MSRLLFALATIFGTLVAALAIITAVMDKPLLASMRRTGHWKVLLRNTVLVCMLMLSCLTSAVAALFMASDLAFTALSIAAGAFGAGVLTLLYLGYQYRQVFRNL